MIKDIKLMWKIDKKKETFKMVGIMLLFSIFITNYIFKIDGNYIVFTFYIAPIVMFLVPFLSYYRPLFREVEKEIELEEKYKFMYNKFISKQ